MGNDKPEIQEKIAEIENVARERGIALSNAGDYRRVYFQLLKEAGIISQDVGITAAGNDPVPTYEPTLRQVYFSVNNRMRKGRKVEATTPKQPRNVRYKKYHARLDGKATSVSIHPVLSTMLALYLDTQPGTPSARSAVRKWIQKQLDNNNDTGRAGMSHWLQGVIVEQLVSEELKKRYDAWILEG